MDNLAQREALLKNLSLTLMGMFLGHSTVAAIILLRHGMEFNSLLAFVAVLFIHHMIIMVVLSNMLDFFVYNERDEKLRRINIPIFITLLRLTSMPVIVFLIVLIPEYHVLGMLIGYTAFAFISDFLDGNISRRLHQTTKIGAYLDSISDYAVLIAISIAYMVFDLLPNWFFVLVMIRLFFQWLAAGIMTVLLGKIGVHRSSLLAKASIFLIMTVYAVALLQFLPALHQIYPLISNISMAVVSPVLIASLIEKILMFAGDVRSQKGKN